MLNLLQLKICKYGKFISLFLFCYYKNMVNLSITFLFFLIFLSFLLSTPQATHSIKGEFPFVECFVCAASKNGNHKNFYEVIIK